MASIAVLGTGTLALVSGACLAELGNMVVCVDEDQPRIDRLQLGEVDSDEPGLDEMVRSNQEGKRLDFSSDPAAAILASEVVFLSERGGLESGARSVGRAMDGYRVVIDNCGQDLGSAHRIVSWIADELDERGIDHEFDVVSKPEFLRKGRAVEDFLHPVRFVVGLKSERASSVLKGVYAGILQDGAVYIETGIDSAEAIRLILA